MTTITILWLQVETSLAFFHFVTLKHPFELAVSCIKCSFLYPFQTKCESWPQLMKCCFLTFTFELVTMMAEEDVITLIVECNYTPAFEFWIVWEKTSKKTSNCVTKTSIEIVENNFWSVLSWFANTFNVFAELERIDFEISRWSFGQVTNEKTI